MANSRKFLQPINLLNSATDPTPAVQGDIYYNSTSDTIRFYDGSQWNNIGSGAGSANLVNDLTPQLGGDLDSNGFGIDNLDYLDFDTTTTTAATEGMLVWNDGEGTLELGLKGGNIDLNIGQEEVALCYNGTGATLSKGTVVYVSGAQGQRPSITKSSASAEYTSSKTFGVVAETITNGQEGFVATFGLVRGINTSSFAEGAALWLSASAGLMTTTMPTPPNHAVFIGYCIRQDASSGQIFVKIQNGYEIQELHNVSISSLQDGDILSYNSSNGLWENIQPAQASVSSVSSGSAYPTTSLTNGQLFYNTSNGRTGIYFNSVWKEFSYTTDVAGLDGGFYNTVVFDNSVDGGSPGDLVLVGAYDGGSYESEFSTPVIDGGSP